MRPVLQATAWYRPYDSGGTEVYLESLVDELRRLGIACEVLTPRAAAAPLRFEHRGVAVETYPVGPPSGRTREEGPPHAGFDAFLDALRRRREAIYHQHAWTRGCGPHHLRAARALGLRTVLTAHVPGVVCLSGTMLRDGVRPCEGEVSPQICAACWTAGRGLSPALARALASLPPALSRRAACAPGRLGTALSARARAEAALRRVVEMGRDADRIVALCGWMREALRRRGAPEAKLALSPQGLSRDLRFAASPAPPGPLRLLLLARLDATKGIDTAVRAVRAAPRENLRLDVHALPQPGDAAYAGRLRALAAGDPRIRFAPPVSRDALPGVLAGADALLVPSRWLETGPLTVLEAQAAGLYVIGANRGGVAERLADDPAAELVEAEDVEAWTAAIARAADRKAEGRLPRTVRPPRAMAEAAADMAALYCGLG